MNYARIPHFCASIALQSAGEIIVGVIYDPVTDELFTAEKGGGAYLNGERIAVSEIDKLRKSAIAIGFAKSVETLQA